jgi:hypothetical protein
VRRPKPTRASVAVFTEYHDTDDQSRAYAASKIASGTAPLTPESVRYMSEEIARRKAAKARAAAAQAELKKEKADGLAG